MVRAANTGVTCLIDEFGRLVRATSHIPDESLRLTNTLQDKNGSTFTRGVLIGDIDVAQGRQLTFYALHGEWFAECCAVITAVALLTWLALRRKL
jgi:apolipoprotein N-acyltransferase